MSESITKVNVWSVRLRWAHGLLALSTLFLLLTGWLSGSSGDLAETARGYHFLAGYVFSLSLLFRIYLLFAGSKSEHYRDCLPPKDPVAVISQHLRFYLSLGKTELNGWYAHNPFWGPVYLFIFALSILMVLSGFAIGKLYLGSAISLTGLHAFGAGVMLIFVVAHLFAVILHDIKAETTGISAILSGNKYFERDTESSAGPVEFPVKFNVMPGKKDRNS